MTRLQPLNKEMVAYANKNLMLNSLLYDLDLLPEQLMSQYEEGNITEGLRSAFMRFYTIVGHFKEFEEKLRENIPPWPES